jgi:AcrR family transcriptional regulator
VSRVDSEKVAKRGYRSRLRDERAADTRERIVTAARELFVNQGYDAATVAAIAERAGVAEPTVYATFRSKQAIMAALMARTEREAQLPAWLDKISKEPDPASKLDLFAAWSRTLFTISHDLASAVLRGGPFAELLDEGERHRRQAIDDLIAVLNAAGALRHDLPRRQVADRAWILTGPEVYLLATACGWPPTRYQRWLAELLRDQLLQPEPGSTPVSNPVPSRRDNAIPTPRH